MIERPEAPGGWRRESQGALVVDVAEPEDTKEVPPCILLKSDGAALYATTDLATLVQREQDFPPGPRCSTWWTSARRCTSSRCSAPPSKAGIVPPETKLQFLGFGTMNGKDGKPFKTREGGVMRLEHLIDGDHRRRLRQNRGEPGHRPAEDAADRRDRSPWLP